jgi:hypothetical protein
MPLVVSFIDHNFTVPLTGYTFRRLINNTENIRERKRYEIKYLCLKNNPPRVMKKPS